mgnify:CR=1 FL=1
MKYQKKQPTERICPICGRKFEAAAENRIYCNYKGSNTCAQSVYRKRQKQNEIVNRDRPGK